MATIFTIFIMLALAVNAHASPIDSSNVHVNDTNISKNDSTLNMSKNEVTTLLYTQPTLGHTGKQDNNAKQSVNFNSSQFKKEPHTLVIDESTLLSAAFISTIYCVGNNDVKDYIGNKLLGPSKNDIVDHESPIDPITK